MSHRIFALVIALVLYGPFVYGLESNGVVTLIDTVRLPAETEGVLLEFTSKEGAAVTKGEILAKVDDSRAATLRKIAQLEWEVQQRAADNDARIRATQGNAEVAQAEYDESVAINERVSQAIPLLKVRRLMLSAKQAELEVEVAQMESHIDQLKESLKRTQLESTEHELARCELTAPLDGVIVERYKHVGEWVTSGEPVLRIVRMDRLRIEWLLKVADVAPHLAAGRDIVAEVHLAPGESQQVRGQVSFVSPIVEPTDEYRVWCEFDNPRDEQGRWLLRAGLEATVHLADTDAK
jgi:multidrug efflux pump subunit AcrA (membrane-fusion protein)